MRTGLFLDDFRSGAYDATDYDLFKIYLIEIGTVFLKAFNISDRKQQ
jgi:hypothetical protein